MCNEVSGLNQFRKSKLKVLNVCYKRRLSNASGNQYDLMKTPILLLALSTLAPAAIITTAFDNGSGDNLWSTATNWSPDGVPNNNASDQFEVTLPASLASPVVLNTTVTLNSLTVGASTTLSQNNGMGLTLARDSTNNGTI